ncbi:alanine--tRNA ligase [Enorma phocaeensis]|uniref:Alanine--tRNA ligase n=1 Tax=Enorma phocaeensis TaxID=1871019 RepID=A0A921LUN7_9ACTN|nr:alanine--tRNA ligase [Enorma phocaeensis]HJG36995.1 alanine--tRNA ligase [Enorma phocaeensis]
MAAEFPSMTTAEIRSSFLSFFEERGCKVFPSSSLIPDDPSLLLANAGMNQFKQYYLGKKTMKEVGAASCQKCVRTNDIDVIGSDGRHLSFFEMLGDFSFGGIPKAEACKLSLEYITEVLHLPMDRLYFTVFTDDDECFKIWEDLGALPGHISRLGEDDNFWAAGPTGPCGPCSEIYYDQGEEFGCGSPDCAPGCDCDRYLEFWNLVFTQYDRQEDGSMPELPHRNLDTGMGLERIAAIMQGARSNYETDILRGLIALGEEISGATYEPGVYEGASRSLRILADHSRAVTFMLADGIRPGNEGRGYVLRRLIRRAIMHGHLLGIREPFMRRYAEAVIDIMGEHYHELVDQRALVIKFLESEEERFGATIETGTAYLDEALSELEKGGVLDGRRAFTLHDTFGFPIDLTVEIAESRGYSVDTEGFEVAMAEQRERARAQVKDVAWSKFDSVWLALSDTLAPTVFCGYDENEASARVVAIVKDGASVESVKAGDACEVVLDHTPFYGERGGQCGDTGALSTEAGARFAVSDTVWQEKVIAAHAGTLEVGELSVGDEVVAAIDIARRERIRRNHTATHLLHAALRHVLGTHVAQEGSYVDDERLRFDFTHFSSMTIEELTAVEQLVNEWIFEDLPVSTQIMGIEEAKATGAMALFTEKYGDEVRVVSCGEVSSELCGGTHARSTSELGLIKIVSESSTGANIRRIEAVTSMGAIAYMDERLAMLEQAAAELKCRIDEVPARIASLQESLHATEQKLKAALTGGSSDAIGHAIDSAEDLGAYKLVVAQLEGLEAADLRNVWDTIRQKVAGPVACVLATVTSKGQPALLAGATDEAVAAGFKSGDIIKQIAPLVGGGGGGRPQMAQAGGKDASGIRAALEAARASLRG